MRLATRPVKRKAGLLHVHFVQQPRFFSCMIARRLYPRAEVCHIAELGGVVVEEVEHRREHVAVLLLHGVRHDLQRALRALIVQDARRVEERHIAMLLLRTEGMLLDRFLPSRKRQRLDVDVDRFGKPGHKLVLHLRVFLAEDDVVRQKDAAGLQDARILLECALLVRTDEHREHRLVDDDIEARILEGKRESAAADDGELVSTLR